MDYEQLKIKEYDFWDLYLHIYQFPYIGRCYAWAKRDNAQKATDMNSFERDELFETITPAWGAAVYKLFKHDWPNIAIFSNTAKHLHAHLIPRYNSPREFYGIEFTDPNPKGNYAPYPKKEIPNDILIKIKEDISCVLK